MFVIQVDKKHCLAERLRDFFDTRAPWSKDRLKIQSELSSRNLMEKQHDRRNSSHEPQAWTAFAM